MNPGSWMLRTLLVVILILYFAGCDMQAEDVSTGPLPSIPNECIILANLLDNALYGMYELAQVSQLQVTRAMNRFDECLQENGLSAAESRAVVRDRVNTFRERPGTGDVDNAGDFFVF